MQKEFTGKETLELIKPRPEESNKGSFGCLTMLCGNENMTGAAALAATTALRSGLGLLRFTGNEETVKRMQQIIFEPVFQPLETIWDSPCTAFLCGCGIGRTYDEQLTDILENCAVPAVIDADCINFLSMHIDILERMKCEKILTPHPGEMARLTGRSVAEIQASRESAASEFAKRFGCILVLKGHNTVIADPNGNICINTSGSSALAKGGSGDVLAGLIGSLAAQGYDLYTAAKLGVYLHGAAADSLASELGKCGVIPSDLPYEIGRLLG